LRALVAKGAAIAIGENPQRFRAIRPADLYARILDEESQKLERLEAQIARVPDEGAQTFVPITSERAFLSLAGRAVVREKGELSIVGPVRILSSLLPTIRKRIADGGSVNIWVLGELVEFPIPTRGVIPQERASVTFHSAVALVVLEQAALAARIQPKGLSGYWTSDQTVLGATRASMLALTTGAP
jgi:sugar-specific transcriptional regulator TrmB